MAAKKPNAFQISRPIFYTGNSSRTQRRKKAQQKIAAQNTNPITSFFKKQDETSVDFELEPAEPTNNNTDLDFESVLSDLKILLNDKTLSFQSKSRLQLIF